MSMYLPLILSIDIIEFIETIVNILLEADNERDVQETVENFHRYALHSTRNRYNGLLLGAK